MVPILLGIGLFWSCSETGPEARAQQHYQRGVEYEAQDMPASAAREYEEAAATGMMEAYYALGAIYGKEEQHERAIGAYRALLRQWPEEERARKGLADQYLAVGRAAEAGALYEALLAEGRPWEGLWGRLGDARLVAGDAEGAEEAYRKMLAAAPDSARVRYSLAQLWAEQGQRREAIAEYRQLLKNPAWVGRGRAVLGRSALGSRGSGGGRAASAGFVGAPARGAVGAVELGRAALSRGALQRILGLLRALAGAGPGGLSRLFLARQALRPPRAGKQKD